MIYTESIFMDSGAYSIYGLHVGETKERMGRHGRNLDRVKRKRWGAGDYSYYNLAKGSEFREYCDRYAEFMKKLKGTDVLFTTVDAIMNPKVSWDVQQYFEEEHGLKPIPVIHGGTPIRYLMRYLEAGRYDMIGLGGLGHIMRINTYTPWADEVWYNICPASNKHLPLVKVHGFAMTSWTLMTRWPWWSVDSATWIKLAAYGWILVPHWNKEQGFHHDVPPLQINLSRKEVRDERSSPNKGIPLFEKSKITVIPESRYVLPDMMPSVRSQKFWWRQGVKGPRQMKDRHYDNTTEYVRECVHRWLDHLKVPMGSFKGEEVKERGVTSDFRIRARVNLHYFKDFEESRPEWPSPLDAKIVERHAIKYRRGFGFI